MPSDLPQYNTISESARVWWTAEPCLTPQGKETSSSVNADHGPNRPVSHPNHCCENYELTGQSKTIVVCSVSTWSELGIFRTPKNPLQVFQFELCTCRVIRWLMPYRPRAAWPPPQFEHGHLRQSWSIGEMHRYKPIHTMTQMKRVTLIADISDQRSVVKTNYRPVGYPRETCLHHSFFLSPDPFYCECLTLVYCTVRYAPCYFIPNTNIEY